MKNQESVYCGCQPIIEINLDTESQNCPIIVMNCAVAAFEDEAKIILRVSQIFKWMQAIISSGKSFKQSVPKSSLYALQAITPFELGEGNFRLLDAAQRMWLKGDLASSTVFGCRVTPLMLSEPGSFGFRSNLPSDVMRSFWDLYFADNLGVSFEIGVEEISDGLGAKAKTIASINGETKSNDYKSKQELASLFLLALESISDLSQGVEIDNLLARYEERALILNRGLHQAFLTNGIENLQKYHQGQHFSSLAK